MTLFNGAICPICDTGFIGAHTCDPGILLDKAAYLIRTAQAIMATPKPTPAPAYPPSAEPCFGAGSSIQLCTTEA